MKAQVFFIGLLGMIFIACNEPKAPVATTVSATAQEEKHVAQGEEAAAQGKEAGDEQAILFLHEVSIQQIQTGKLAQTNTKNKDINNLGAQMEKIYSKVLGEITTLAEKRGIELPASLNENGLGFFESMKKKQEADFDKTYCSIMIGDHLTVVDEMENLAKTSKDESTQKVATPLTVELKELSPFAIECKTKFVK